MQELVTQELVVQGWWCWAGAGAGDAGAGGDAGGAAAGPVVVMPVVPAEPGAGAALRMLYSVALVHVRR